MIRAIHPKRNFDPPKFRGVKILYFIILSILNPKAIKMRRPLVQNRSDEEWTKSILRNEDFHWAGYGDRNEMHWPNACLSVSQSVGQSVCLSKRLSLIAPDRLEADPVVTNTIRCAKAPERRWRLSRGATCHVCTCHVPPRVCKKFLTATNHTVAEGAQIIRTESRRDMKLSG